MTNTKMPRVLFITTEAPDVLFGGLGFFNDLMWQELRRRNFPFLAVYVNRHKSPPSKLADVNVSVSMALPFDGSVEVKSVNEAWTTRVALESIIREFKPDVISVHEVWTIMPFYFDLARVQFTFHSSHVGMEHYLARTLEGLQAYWEQRIAVRQSGALVLHSQWIDNMIKQYVASDRIEPDIFPIGLRPQDYPELKVRHPEGKLVVSFFGRYHDVAKNFMAYRDAILSLPADYRSRIEARIYGPYAEDSETAISLLEQGFVGLNFVQGKAKWKALEETDVIVMPSTRESFGIVGLEALLSNCLLVATPNLGMDSYMAAENACEPTAQAIRDRLIQVLDDKETLYARQERNEFRRMALDQGFEVEKMADRYIEVWSRLAAQNASTTPTTT